MGHSDKLALSINDACKTLGIGRTKLYELIGSGKLKARRIDRRTLILQMDIVDLLESLPQARPEAK